MNGYLQRLVQTATSPAESIHPWTASVFAAGYQGEFHDFQSEEVAPPAAAMQLHENSAQSSQTSVPGKILLPVAERISELRTTQIIPGASEAEQGAHRELLFRKRLIPEPLIAGADIAKATELEPAPTKWMEGAIAPRGHGPLVRAEAVVKSGNADGLAVGSSLVPRDKDKKDAGAVRDSVSVDRQRDEIQIHIGRIEVTAVYPSPPRAPKARVKEISLDAYLKRRDGRAG